MNRIRRMLDVIIFCLLYKKWLLYITIISLVLDIIHQHFLVLTVISMILNYELIILRLNFNKLNLYVFVFLSVLMPFSMLLFLNTEFIGFLVLINVLIFINRYYCLLYLKFNKAIKKVESNYWDRLFYFYLLSPPMIHISRRIIFRLIKKETQ